MVAPKKPSRLALWIDQNGNPDQLKVEYRQTGTDTADTFVILTNTRSKKSTETRPHEIGSERYSFNDDVYVRLGHASIVELTEAGRKRVDEWTAFNKKEAKDLAEYERLKAKFKQPNE